MWEIIFYICKDTVRKTWSLCCFVGDHLFDTVHFITELKRSTFDEFIDFSAEGQGTKGILCPGVVVCSLSGKCWFWVFYFGR